MGRDAHRGRGDRRLRLDASRRSIDDHKDIADEHRHNGGVRSVDVDNVLNDSCALDLKTSPSAGETEQISPRSGRHAGHAGTRGDSPASSSAPDVCAEQRQHRRDPLIMSGTPRRSGHPARVSPSAAVVDRSVVVEARATGVAYGLEFRGDGLGTGLLGVNGSVFPAVTIHHEPTPLPSADSFVDADDARLVLADGLHAITMNQDNRTATFWGPKLAPDELAHPYLGPVGTVFSRWHGREAFHAGALIVAGGAWAIVGPMEAGKSTLLAAFAARGGAVLADDLVIVDGGRAFAGPRSIDLRSPLPAEYGCELPASHARRATRWRLTLADIEPMVPLRGWVFLRWGDNPGLRPMKPAECLTRLATWRARRELRSDPVQMLTLAGLPAFTLSRAREWNALPATLDALVERLVAVER